MEQAEIMGLLRTILIIGLIFFGVRIVMRILLPLAMKLLFKRVQNKMADQMRNQSNSKQNDGYSRQGDVFVKPPQKKKPSQNDKSGEYIDFEEVD